MLVIRVIGELGVELADAKAELPGSRRARALLAWLAVHPGRHSRSRLAAMFWPDVLDASARASLRSAIWALRSALGPDFGAYLATDRDTVTLAGAGLTVDLLVVGQLIADGRPESALEKCRGELLHEFDDDWVIEAREMFDDNVATAIETLVERARAAGDLRGAVAWARRRAALRPLDEGAGLSLMRALAETGDVAAALEAYGKLAQRLDIELGISVSAETAATARQLRAHAPAAGPDGNPDSGRLAPAARGERDGCRSAGRRCGSRAGPRAAVRALVRSSERAGSRDRAPGRRPRLDTRPGQGGARLRTTCHQPADPPGCRRAPAGARSLL